MDKPSPLRNLRRSRTLTQTDLAKLARISQQDLSKYERGRLTPPPATQALLATILGVSRQELFPETVEVA